MPGPPLTIASGASNRIPRQQLVMMDPV